VIHWFLNKGIAAFIQKGHNSKQYCEVFFFRRWLLKYKVVLLVASQILSERIVVSVYLCLHNVQTLGHF
jgi:hypothetical protein